MKVLATLIVLMGSLTSAMATGPQEVTRSLLVKELESALEKVANAEKALTDYTLQQMKSAYEDYTDGRVSNSDVENLYTKAAEVLSNELVKFQSPEELEQYIAEKREKITHLFEEKVEAKTLVALAIKLSVKEGELNLALLEFKEEENITKEHSEIHKQLALNQVVGTYLSRKLTLREFPHLLEAEFDVAAAAFKANDLDTVIIDLLKKLLKDIENDQKKEDLAEPSGEDI